MFLFIFFSLIGSAMEPFRPDVMIFKSPDNKMELHSPVRKKTWLMKKGLLKNEKLTWSDSMSVSYIFSDPSSERLIAIGGLGDSGSDLGEIIFYKLNGEKVNIKLRESIPNLEELSRAYRDFSNFPWISGIDLNQTYLQI